MIATSIPAWLTAVIAIFTGLLGLSGTIINTLVLDRRRRQGLEQERLLHASEGRLNALRHATDTALRYREQAAAAIHLVLRKPPRFGIEPMWSWTPEHRVTCRTHEAELSLLFGAKHPVTHAWKDCTWYIAEAAEFANTRKQWAEPAAGVRPPDVEEIAEKRRHATQDALDYFFVNGRQVCCACPARRLVHQR